MPPTMWRSVQPISIPDGAPAYDCETHGAACPAARDIVGRAGWVENLCRPGLPNLSPGRWAGARRRRAWRVPRLRGRDSSPR